MRSTYTYVRCNYNVRQGGEDKAVKEWNKQGPSSLHEQIDAETAGGGAAGPAPPPARHAARVCGRYCEGDSTVRS